MYTDEEASRRARKLRDPGSRDCYVNSSSSSWFANVRPMHRAGKPRVAMGDVYVSHEIVFGLLRVLGMSSR